ncbi:PDR/VanB family oxidoreductase [Comamonadaceae bacterium G21597-S1]|nr:PDR/VanB family oxidoreductase [Comamonadaceae bacterium G21597-S1]
MSQAMFEVRVSRKRAEAVDICSYELVRPDGKALPVFSAGAHIDVQVPGGMVRQYSLCNDATLTTHYLIAVLRDPKSRGGSVAMHDALQEGDLLRISEPKNHFPLVHAAKRSLLMAGGIGVTPILCMAQRLHNTDAEFEMHYCTRSLERTAFHGRIAGSEFARRVHFHHDDGPIERKLDIAALLAQPIEGTHLYVCGPAGFLEFVLASARKAGWNEGQIHYEFFGAEVVHVDTDVAFDVKIASTGKVYTIAADKSVTTALAEQGVEIPVSCEQGVCGTCLTRVLEGEPDHRDQYLLEEERVANDQFTPCCSRARSRLLVLDL